MPETRTIVQLHKKDDREKRWIPLSTGKCVELTDYENNGETGNIETTDDLNNALAKLENRKADIGSTLSDYNIEDAYTKDEVDALLASIYRVQGGIESTDVHGKLSNPDTRIGDVYDLKDDMVMTSDFIEYEQGVTKTISAGTNIVVVEDENENLKFDVLALSVSGQDTTYTISFSNGVLTLTPSIGTAQTVNIPDTDTTYALSISGRTITLTPSTGTADTVTVPTELPALSGNTNKYLKVIDNGGTLTVSWEAVSTGTTYSAGTGLELSQQNVFSAKLKSTTAATNDSENISNTQGRQYAVVPDKTNGYLSVNVPWEDHQYSNETAAQGGTTESLVTTGDKYNWNNKLDSHQTIKQDGITGATVNRFGTCNTSASTATKEVTITGTLSLEAGARVTVKFSNKNTANSPKLKVGSTTAKDIYIRGVQITTTNQGLLSGICDFIYDGTYWNLISNAQIDEQITVSSGSFLTSNTLPIESGRNYTFSGDISSLIITTTNATGDLETNITFKLTSNATGTLVTLPLGAKYVKDEPTWEAGGEYIISYYKNLFVFGEIGTKS